MANATEPGLIPDNPIPIVSENLSIDDYIKASVNAGDRVRRLIYIMVFASAIAFMAYWNSKETGWINERYKNILEATEKYNKHDSLLDNINMESLSCNMKNDSLLDSFLMKREINTKNKLTSYQKIYTDLEEGVYSVKVPILGINFDINDLDLFASITLDFLLLLIIFEIEREYENLFITFNFASNNKMLDQIYIYLAMGQVLAYPPKPYRKSFTKGDRGQLRLEIRKHVTKSLYALPSVILLIILIHDLKTSGLASSTDYHAFLHETSICMALFSISCYLGYKCIRITLGYG